MSDDPFNGADPAAFDHDGDNRPGGSRPKRYPLIDRATGVVVVVGAKARNKALAADTARLATERDLRLAGRRDLIPLLTA